MVGWINKPRTFLRLTGRGKWQDYHYEGFILSYLVADTLRCLPNSQPAMPAPRPSSSLIEPKCCSLSSEKPCSSGEAQSLFSPTELMSLAKEICFRQQACETILASETGRKSTGRSQERMLFPLKGNTQQGHFMFLPLEEC